MTLLQNSIWFQGFTIFFTISYATSDTYSFHFYFLQIGAWFFFFFYFHILDRLFINRLWILRFSRTTIDWLKRINLEFNFGWSVLKGFKSGNSSQNILFILFQYIFQVSILSICFLCLKWKRRKNTTRFSSIKLNWGHWDYLLLSTFLIQFTLLMYKIDWRSVTVDLSINT